MYITDAEALTGIRICPFCKSYCYNPKVDRHLSRFEEHKIECEKRGGKRIREVKLDNTQKPYAPHIQKQKIYQFLLARGLQQYFQPTRYYITFDFETLEDPVNESITDHTTLDANLVPFMVSSTVKFRSGIRTVNFCLAKDLKLKQEQDLTI